jgi:hypothetical protein
VDRSDHRVANPHPGQVPRDFSSVDSGKGGLDRLDFVNHCGGMITFQEAGSLERGVPMLESHRARLLALMIVGVGTVMLASVRVEAQEPPAVKPAAAKKTFDPSRRVPAFFGQIGLSQDQKEEIYKVRARHLEKIAALQKQIDEIKAEEMKECESRLSESQKVLLEARRRAAAEAKKAKAALKVDPKTTANTATPAKSEK